MTTATALRGGSESFLRACQVYEKTLARGLKLHGLFNHAWYRKQMERLNRAELEFMFDFLAEHGHLDQVDYYLKARDVFLDAANVAKVRKSTKGTIGEVLEILKEA